MRNTLYILLTLILIGSVYASGSISTGALQPPQKSMCGNALPTTSAIEAQNLVNLEASALTNVTATINVAPNNGGLTVTSPTTIAIGTINASSTYPGSVFWNVSCNSNYVGNYTVYVTYTATGGYTASSLGQAISSINVSPNLDTVPPIISNPTPGGLLSSTTVNFSVTTSEPAMCRYDPAESSAFSGNTFDSYFTNGYTTVHQAVLSGLGEGTYTYNIKCADQAGNFQKTATRITFTIDLTAPEITDAYPNRMTTTYGTFVVNTGEDATCKYASNASVGYENMTGIFQGFLKVHNTTLSRLARGVNNVYVKCKDAAGNIASSDFIAQVIFEAGPSAEITTSKASPFKSGVLDLTVKTTDDLQSAPRLTYSLDGKGETGIILSGEADLWKGYLVLPDTLTGEQVGTFSFSGTDEYGNAGTTITKGSVFLVDNLPPPKVDGLGINAANNSLHLKWSQVADNIDYYYIYKSQYNNVTEKDYLILTPKTSYDDQKIETGRTYFYKVAAVDTAGNVGPLSEEISMSGTGRSSSQTQEAPAVTETKSDTVDRSEIEAMSSSLLAEMTDLTSSIKTIRTELKEQHPLEAELFDIVSVTRQAEQKITEMRKGIDNAATTTEATQYQAQIEGFKSQLANLKKTVPNSINVLDKQSLEITPDKDAIKTVYKQYLGIKKINYTERDAEDYYTRNENVIQSAKVKATSRLIKIVYLDEHEETFTAIEKAVDIAGVPTQGLIVLESIPKSVIDDASQLKSTVTNYDILLSDPLLRWRITSASKQTLSYLVPTTVNSDDLKKIITAVLPDATSGTKSSNSVSGLAIVRKIEFYSGMDWWLIVILFLLLCGLGGYYYTMGSDGSTLALDKVTDKIKLPSFGGSISKAHKDIDDMKYQDALNAYTEVIKSPPKDTASATQLSDLYHKLLLFSHLQYLQHSAMQQDSNGVREQLAKVNELLMHIMDKNGNLCKVAAHSLSFYSAQVANMNMREATNTFEKLRMMRRR